MDAPPVPAFRELGRLVVARCMTRQDTNEETTLKIRTLAALLAATLGLSACGGSDDKPAVPTTGKGASWKLRISDNGRYLVKGDGSPFFWQGDTAWLMISKLSREEIDQYLAKRQTQGYNVAQVMLVHDLDDKSYYGVPAINDRDVSKPNLTPGADPSVDGQYDFWDHLDYAVRKAESMGIYLALVPLWGSAAVDGSGKPTQTAEQAAAYASFLADRYKNSPNIIWLNGGDIYGDRGKDVWQAIGSTLHEKDDEHLVTFHPRGRTTSSDWFQNEKWLDFNMFQSGHRNYAQDDDKSGHLFGEDNYRFVQHDLALLPLKPTIDGEPSYEDVVQGLHYSKRPAGTPYWRAADARRYAYWSVFAGAFGHTYGHVSLMAMFRGTEPNAAAIESEYGPPMKTWSEALEAEGGTQMHWLKELMLSRPVLERVPDDAMLADQDDTHNVRYDHVVATHGKRYAFAYTYTGRTFQLNMGAIEGTQVKAAWFNPRDGHINDFGIFQNTGVLTFDPPGEPAEGNDWVLILDSK